ncbi:MAG: trigger factor [Oscillatoriales cyanobacterium]|nr:MAG: trigger factor [Oscillatoriales cyanobacterium]
MKVTQEKLPASQVGLDIEIPADTTKKSYDRVIAQYKRSLNIPGFRKGKVPTQVLLNRVGAERIKAAVLEEMIQNSIEQAIKQESIDALGNYGLKDSFEELVERFNPGQALSFSATVDVPPEATVSNYAGLSITAEEVVYDPAQVDAYLEEVRSEQADLVPVEGRPCEAGDTVTADYTGVLVKDGTPEAEPFEGGSAEDFQIELTEGRFIAGFVENIIGMSAGETKTFPVTFPDAYGREELAGQDAQFTIVLKEIKAKELPALDDDFAKAVSEFDTLEEFRASLEEQRQEDAKAATKTNIAAAIRKAIVDCIEVELPKTLVDREIEMMLTQTAMQLQQYGIDVRQVYNEQNLPQIRERSRPEAETKLLQDLALREVAKLESITVTEDELNERVAEVKEQLRDDQDIDTDRLLEYVRDDLTTQKTLDWLQEKAAVELVPEGTLSKAEEDEAEATDEAEAVEAADATVDVTAE